MRYNLLNKPPTYPVPHFTKRENSDIPNWPNGGRHSQHPERVQRAIDQRIVNEHLYGR